MTADKKRYKKDLEFIYMVVFSRKIPYSSVSSLPEYKIFSTIGRLNAFMKTYKNNIIVLKTIEYKAVEVTRW